MRKIGFWAKKLPDDPIGQFVYAGMMALQAIGVVKPQEGTPQMFVDPHWLDTTRGRDEFKAVLMHLGSGKVHEAYYGWEECRLCRQVIGTKDFTDGQYVWPEGYAHYVQEHGVRPPQEFVDHVMKLEGEERNG